MGTKLFLTLAGLALTLNGLSADKSYKLTFLDTYFNISADELDFVHKLSAKATINLVTSPENENLVQGEIISPTIEEEKDIDLKALFPTFSWIKKDPIEHVKFELEFKPDKDYSFTMIGDPTKSARAFMNWMVETIVYGKWYETKLNKREDTKEDMISTFFGQCKPITKVETGCHKLTIEISVDPAKCSEGKEINLTPNVKDEVRKAFVFDVEDNKKNLREISETIRFVTENVFHQIYFHMKEL